MICISHQILVYDQIKNEILGKCGTYAEKRGVYRDLVGKFLGKRPPGRPRFS